MPRVFIGGEDPFVLEEMWINDGSDMTFNEWLHWKKGIEVTGPFTTLLYPGLRTGIQEVLQGENKACLHVMDTDAPYDMRGYRCRYCGTWVETHA